MIKTDRSHSYPVRAPLIKNARAYTPQLDQSAKTPAACSQEQKFLSQRFLNRTAAWPALKSIPHHYLADGQLQRVLPITILDLLAHVREQRLRVRKRGLASGLRNIRNEHIGEPIKAGCASVVVGDGDVRAVVVQPTPSGSVTILLF